MTSDEQVITHVKTVLRKRKKMSTELYLHDSGDLKLFQSNAPGLLVARLTWGHGRSKDDAVEFGNRVVKAVNSYDELVAVLGELTEACEAEFTSEETEEGPNKTADEESVACFDRSPITFGMIRRARAALSKAGASQ